MTEYEYIAELKKLALEITIQFVKSTAEVDVILNEIVGSHDWVTWFNVLLVSNILSEVLIEVRLS